MDINMQKRNEVLAQNVIKGLESRNMSGYYAADREAAVKQALELIPEGSSIAMGGCTSAHEIGLIKALEDGNYNYINRAKLAPRERFNCAVMCLSFFSWVSVLYTMKPTRHMPSKKMIRGTSVFFFTWFTSFYTWKFL